MSDLTIIQDQALTMTSREIAELVGSRHDDTKRSIERLANQGVIVQPPTADEPGQDALGRPRVTQVYVFSGERGKRDSIIVVAQLSPEFTARLVDRWQELEKAHAKPALDLDDPASLRTILLGYAEKVIALQSKVQEVEAVVEKQAPKVEAFDRIATSADGSFCLTDAAKLLQIQPKRLTQELQAMEWIHRRPMGSGWLAYQHRIQQGLLEHKVTTGEKSDGREWVSTQVRITAKGLARLSQLLLAAA